MARKLFRQYVDDLRDKGYSLNKATLYAKLELIEDRVEDCDSASSLREAVLELIIWLKETR